MSERSSAPPVGHEPANATATIPGRRANAAATSAARLAPVVASETRSVIGPPRRRRPGPRAERPVPLRYETGTLAVSTGGFPTSVANRLSLDAYHDLALNDPDGFWELWDGESREKPGMSVEHSRAAFGLGVMLDPQLDPAVWEVRIAAPRTRWTERNVFIPDVAIVPRELADAQANQPGCLELDNVPLPLVVEVGSRTAGDYDLAVKVAAYQARGDAEIWRLQPNDRSLTRWPRQPNGTYTKETVTGGAVELVALPGVTVDLDALFAR